ncbi:hypothetical protein [Streptomyces acidiscabies]|uniref:hypothetical protein n=1 Tax=Streptomyces acidiscabies TaxID=42234 RepID=UPI000E683DEA|nr:hypothetical protein [Streptomyces acidiscabies]MBP5942601.1 hypothetical protein [Streptomyces sp. LBUM 1476]
MTAQPEHPAQDSQVLAIPHTINAIGDALSGEQRARFYGEVLAAVEKEVPLVMRRWWCAAMLHSARGAETSRANAVTGRGLVPVEDLLEQVERQTG